VAPTQALAVSKDSMEMMRPVILKFAFPLTGGERDCRYSKNTYCIATVTVTKTELALRFAFDKTLAARN
jgi:hypothetical protein